MDYERDLKIKEFIKKNPGVAMVKMVISAIDDDDTETTCKVIVDIRSVEKHRTYTDKDVHDAIVAHLPMAINQSFNSITADRAELKEEYPF